MLWGTFNEIHILSFYYVNHSAVIRGLEGGEKNEGKRNGKRTQ